MTELWTTLSERESTSAAPLRDGVPAGLEGPLREWVYGAARKRGHAAARVAVRCNIDLRAEDMGSEDVDHAERLAYRTPANQLLDAVDALLGLIGPGPMTPPPSGSITWYGALHMLQQAPAWAARSQLQQLLNDSRSLYTVRADGQALARRTDPAVAALLATAAEAADQPERGSATRHLRQASDAAYALKPDPVKAYSEAIKAVEAAAHTTMQPNHPKATLGTMLGELRQVRGRLTVPLLGKNATEGIETVEKMMELLWTGQTSRHGNLQNTRDETVDEATMAVHIAATLVQMFASGAVRRS
ncbi:hypothetical protein J5Y04_31575 [Kitasatospora sp. RG8]|uniref:hypothetical protein n=1 Tax=Kitasatospora sp. RG8 TaxID=2820815 RepID=UPI001AE06997|nr:hypothetical protein [Kitasatospora sp. RG8]MBP0454048.1 hypothetical protein [Kitasatospora sp. RG8]